MPRSERVKWWLRTFALRKSSPRAKVSPYTPVTLTIFLLRLYSIPGHTISLETPGGRIEGSYPSSSVGEVGYSRLDLATSCLWSRRRAHALDAYLLAMELVPPGV